MRVPPTPSKVVAGAALRASRSPLDRIVPNGINDLFQAVVGANFGIGREFNQTVVGSGESFVRWGLEDNEFGYRAYCLRWVADTRLKGFH